MCFLLDRHNTIVPILYVVHYYLALWPCKTDIHINYIVIQRNHSKALHNLNVNKAFILCEIIVVLFKALKIKSQKLRDAAQAQYKLTTDRK